MNPSSKTARRHLLAASAAALCALTLSVHAQAPQYTITVLDSVGGTVSQEFGINASGQVVGYSRQGCHSRGNLWR